MPQHDIRNTTCECCGNKCELPDAKKCNRCWELSGRIGRDPELAQQMLLDHMIEMPDELSAEDREHVQHCIEMEGFDYCFTEYSSFQNVGDKKFHALRQLYVEAQQALALYVGETTEE